MPSCRATALAVVRLSPVSMMTLMPSAASAFSAIRRRSLDGIGDGEQPGEFAVDRDVDHGGAVAAQALGFGIQRPGFDAERCQEVRIAEQQRSCRRPCRSRPCRSASRTLRPCPDRVGVLLRIARWRRRADARWRARRWRRAAGFRSRRNPAAGNDRDDLRLALGQRAGLVDHQRVDLFHALQRFGVLDQHAGLRRRARRRP